MVGAEWRKASRLFEAHQEKIREGAYFTNEQNAAAMLAAWDALPHAFREKIEKRIWDRQYKDVHAASERDMALKREAYEARQKEAREAEASYKKVLIEVQAEQGKLENMKTHIEVSKALRTFLKALGVEQNLRLHSEG